MNIVFLETEIYVAENLRDHIHFVNSIAKNVYLKDNKTCIDSFLNTCLIDVVEKILSMFSYFRIFISERPIKL